MTYNNDNLKNLSQEDLIILVQDLQVEVNNLKEGKIQTDLLSFPWVGDLGQWYWVIGENLFVYNDNMLKNLGYTREDANFTIDYNFFTDKIHPDDLQKNKDLVMSHLEDNREAYCTEYRIKHKKGHYIWHESRGIVTKRSKDGKPLLMSGICLDISKNKLLEKNLSEAYQKLVELVITDDLTQTLNKRGFIEKLNYEILCFKRTKKPFSLLMFDIDNLKHINDTYGHSAGDQILIGASSQVKKRLRATDFLARSGGDEFFIILPDTDLKSAITVAEELRVILTNLEINEIKGIKASFGVTEYDGSEDADKIMQKVDNLMYKSKNSGGNSVISVL